MTGTGSHRAPLTTSLSLSGWMVLLFLLGLIWSRGQRILGHDSFAYLEFAKAFATELPNHFGDWWPYGYPLAGGLLARLGLSAHTALLAISGLSFLSMLCLTIYALPGAFRNRADTRLIISAAISAPVCAQLFVGAMSEPLFSALLFGLAISMGAWPKRTAIGLSALLALLAFCVRYSGVFAFGAVGLYALYQWKELQLSGNRRFLLGSLATCTLIATALCWTNYLALGRFAGPQPVGEESIASWPYHFSQMGWSLIGSLSSGRIVARVENTNEVVAFAIGVMAMAGIGWLLTKSWRSRNSQFTQPVALVAGLYLLSMVTLRATTPFDAISSPRTMLPALFLLTWLLIEQVCASGMRFVRICAFASLILSVGLAGRGISPTQRPDLTVTREFLASILKPGDTVAVNARAINLAAYFPNRFCPAGNCADSTGPAWTVSSNWNPNESAVTVIVLNDTQEDFIQRQGKPEIGYVRAAIEAGECRLVRQTSESIVLEACCWNPQERPPR